MISIFGSVISNRSEGAINALTGTSSITAKADAKHRCRIEARADRYAQTINKATATTTLVFTSTIEGFERKRISAKSGSLQKIFLSDISHAEREQSMTFNKITIAGAGTMGSQTAWQMAFHGKHVMRLCLRLNAR